jgi:anti-sigma factor RsiW
MKQELKLQAYLDGELSGREAKRVETLIETDASARSLFTELRQTSAALKGNEPEVRLPETREFYWSKIEREIARLDVAPTEIRVPAWLMWVRRHLAAVSGVSVAAALVMFAALQMNWVSQDLFEEIDNPLEDSGAFSFRSESQKMTVVWIPGHSASEESDDTIEEIQ